MVFVVVFCLGLKSFLILGVKFLLCIDCVIVNNFVFVVGMIGCILYFLGDNILLSFGIIIFWWLICLCGCGDFLFFVFIVDDWWFGDRLLEYFEYGFVIGFCFFWWKDFFFFVVFFDCNERFVSDLFIVLYEEVILEFLYGFFVDVFEFVYVMFV